jgi:MFS transporter, FSR family, fosmidomycin resistance protein
MSEATEKQRALLALALGHFVVDLQSSGLAMLIPMLRAELGLDYAAAAAIVTVQTLTSSIIQPAFGLASDRHPVRAALPVACLLAGMGTALALFMPSYTAVLLVVILTGLGSAMYHALGSLNANFLSGSNKATGISRFFAGGQFGYAAGPLLLVFLLQVFGPRGTLGMLVPALIGFVALVVMLPNYARGSTWQAHQRQAGAGPASITLSRRKTAWGMTTIVGVITVRSVIQTGLITFIPLYIVSIMPGSKDYAALLLSAFVLAGGLGTLLGGPLGDRFSRKAVLVVSMGICLPLLLLFLNTTGIPQILSIAVAGASLISAASLTVVMAQELLPNNVGLASGLTLGLGFGAGGLGALALGEVADRFGLPVTMYILALLPIPLVGLTLLLPGKPKPGGVALATGSLPETLNIEA